MAGSGDSLSSNMSLDSTDFKTGLQQARRELRTLDSEFKANVATMGDWSKNSEVLQQRIEMLNKSYAVQSRRVEAVRAEYERVAAEQGENSRAAQDLQIQLNQETEKLGTFSLKIRETNESLEALSASNSGAFFEDLARKQKLVQSEFEATVAGMDDWEKSSEGIQAKTASLNELIELQTEKSKKLYLAMQDLDDGSEDNAKALDEATLAYNQSQAELGKLEKELRQVGDSSKKSDKEVKTFGERLKDLGKGVADGLAGVGDKIAGIGKAAGIAVGAVVAGAAAGAVKLGQAVINQFGELEQNLGGSEAVFQDYADHMQKIGEDAYKNLGVSQSQYLATANKMGALFQGSGLDVQKSAELSEKAMQRAADMASVMGIDMQTALDSVTGAAKGNFTMMDNLGVAMNATTIEAYAASKGLDFVWASASQAEKSEMAMQMFFESTEQYAGNFAKESTQTISGSLGLLKAAVGSFTAGLGNANANMTNLTENVVDAFGSVVKNIVPVLQNVVKALPKATDGILKAIGDLVPVLLPVVSGIFTQVLTTIVDLLPGLLGVLVGALTGMFGAIVDLLPNMISLGVEMVDAFVGAIGTMAPLLLAAAPGLIMQLVNGLLQMLPQLIQTGTEVVFALIEGIGQLLPQLIPAAVEMIVTIINGIAQALPQLMTMIAEIIPQVVIVLIQNLPLLIGAALQLIVALVDGLVQALPVLIGYVPEIIIAIVGALVQSLPMIISSGKQIIESLINGITGMFATLKTSGSDAVNKVLNGIKSMFSTLYTSGSDLIGEVIDGIKNSFSGLWDLGRDIVLGIWEGIKDKWADLKSWVSDLFKNLIGGAEEDNEVHSPSRLWARRIGGPIAEGIGFGFLKEMDNVERSMRMTIAGLMPAVESTIPGGGMQPAFGGVGQTVAVERSPVIINVNPSEPIDYELLANKVARKVTEGW